MYINRYFEIVFETLSKKILDFFKNFDDNLID
jgi:hypothetical protein